MLIDGIEINPTVSGSQTAGQTGPRLEVNDSVLIGTYSNLVVVHHTGTEFALDFAFVEPDGEKGRVTARHLLHPTTAARLHRALGEAVAAYEARFGPSKPTP